MTVKYVHHVSSVNIGAIFKLLFRWRGSIVKLIWVDILVYVGLYTILSCVYRLALNPQQKEIFEKLCIYCNSKSSKIPLGFLLGFFISYVLSRWWGIVNNVPGMSKLALYSRAFISHGDQKNCRKIRRRLLRFINMAWILRMRQLSPVIDSRFTPNCSKPTEFLESFSVINQDEVISKYFKKFFKEDEIMIFYELAEEKCNDDEEALRYHESTEYWLPFLWAIRLIEEAKIHGYIVCHRDKHELLRIIEEIRGGLGVISGYDLYNIPLVYVQVCIVGIYSYFLNQLFAEQFLDPAKKISTFEVDFYVPIYGLLEFIFYLGWFKVGQCLLNPMGHDDEDIPLWNILDFNLHNSYGIALRRENLPYQLDPLPGDSYLDGDRTRVIGPQIIPQHRSAKGGNTVMIDSVRREFKDGKDTSILLPSKKSKKGNSSYERHRLKYSHEDQFEGSAKKLRREKLKKKMTMPTIGKSVDSGRSEMDNMKIRSMQRKGRMKSNQSQVQHPGTRDLTTNDTIIGAEAAELFGSPGSSRRPPTFSSSPDSPQSPITRSQTQDEPQIITLPRGINSYEYIEESNV